ncbi:hypothetical protein BHM03_00055397 [Ensete ventricosum]|nr:hypothetical protein BHM03_00055397 [Ensete ventricosum]
MKHLTEELKRQPAEAKLGSEGLGTRQEQRWVLLKKMPQCYNSSCMIRTTGELDCSKAHIRLRELGKSENKAKFKVTDSRAMGMATPWYCRGETSIES